jgi:hypothetical protein
LFLLGLGKVPRPPVVFDTFLLNHNTEAVDIQPVYLSLTAIAQGPSKYPTLHLFIEYLLVFSEFCCFFAIPMNYIVSHGFMDRKTGFNVRSTWQL